VKPKSQRPRLSARQRKLWWSALSITLGTLVLGVLVWWIERVRDTDRADARADVTSTFKQDAIARETPVRFTDVTVAAGLELSTANYHRHRALPEDNGSGLAWGDYDGDGFMDLYVIRHPGIVPDATSGPPPGNKLFHNNGDGTFTDVTERAGVADRDGFGMGATWVDFDDDGLLDLYVTNRGANRLFKNKGDGTFVDVAAHAGVADKGWGTGAAWGDFDRDGHIDLYLCNYVNYDSVGHEPSASASRNKSAGSYEAPYTLNPNSYDPQPNHLFRNRGDGTFEDVTASCGVADLDGRSLAATFVDLDGDGWLDLYVNNDVSPDRLYRNSGADFGPDSPLSFIDLSAVAGTADSRGSMGLSVGEIGNLDNAADGLPDLFITHWVTQENAFYQSLVTPSGKLEYRDKARQFRLGEISIDRVGWGCAMVDFDLDGRVDIAVANGSTLEQNDNPVLLKPEPMFLFMNDGTGFRDVAPLAGAATARPYNARGLAVADYNNDGYPDIAISTNEGGVRLFRNDSPKGNRALTVTLKGRAAYCFGAKIEVWTGGHCQYRWWGADVSYLSQHAPQLIVGLGHASLADKVVVHWTDGKISTLTNVSAGVVRIDHASATTAP
jgi:enediyne biosynthesis protein E4